MSLNVTQTGKDSYSGFLDRQLRNCQHISSTVTSGGQIQVHCEVGTC